MNTNETLIKQQWQDQEALHRFQLISPLLQTDLDDARRLQLRRTIADENNISVRTLYRYEKAFAEKQFAGLRPADREKHRSQKLPENFEFLLEQAIQLRKEVPERSVAQIIYILEAEGLVAPGILKRSTLERHIYRAGYGQKQMQMYKEARNSSSKRFCKPHRMMLIQGDIKYGPKLPIGKMVQRYRLICPLPLMTIPDICFPPDFMIIRKKLSLRIPSIRLYPDTELLMPATLIMEVSTSQNRSGSHLPDLESVSCMPNHVQGKARARLKSSIRWWMTSSVSQSLKISGRWKS